MNEYIKNKHFPARVDINDNAYMERMINNYSDRICLDKISGKYYETVEQEEVDLNLFLMDKLLDYQKKIKEDTGIIVGIMIFSLICSIISVVASLIYFF